MEHEPFEYEVEAEDPALDLRLDVFLAEHTEATITRSQIKRCIDDGQVSVNGKTHKAGYRLRLGDLVRFDYAPPALINLTPQDIPLELLFEDEHLAIVNKPAGMVVHPSNGHPDHTLVNALLHRYAQLSPTDEPTRPGIVHRIDKDTSGSIVITRTKEAHLHLSKLFFEHDLDRRYHALVLDQGLEDQGSFDTLHGRDPKERMRFSTKVTRGKRAITHYRVLERFSQGIALVECTLQTGRTHQIRAHFYDAGCPLIGDQLYGGRSSANTKLIGRQALHARQLAFKHLDGSDVDTIAPYPADFANALDALDKGKRWR